jgi:hypothetical protein
MVVTAYTQAGTSGNQENRNGRGIKTNGKEVE